MPDISSMSDEDFRSTGVAALIEQQRLEDEAAVAAAGQTQEPDPNANPDPEVVQDPVDPVENPDNVNPDPESGTVPAADKTEGGNPDPATATPEVKPDPTAAQDNPDGSGSPTDKPVVAGQEPVEVVPDYKVNYEKIMAPFTANGRKIELKSPEEAVQLMQMGANYTRKMQELAPYRRAATMLQNNKLLDESELSFLIDLRKGDKAAIQKLLKDQGIDPRDIDVDSDPTYQGGNHRVSDAQVDFQSTVDELTAMDRGQETIKEALKWDQASIDAVGQDPAILRAIHDQRVSGVYDIITTEMERRKVLGQISAQTPFLHAYKAVGDELAAAERAKAAAVATAPEAKPAPVAVAKTVVQPKAQVQNGEKAKAASTSRAAPAKPADTDPTSILGLSDDEFQKKFGSLMGRV